MINLIAHRGNVKSPSHFENTIGYLDVALYSGYDIEIDVWNIDGEDCFRLGHDKPLLNQSVPLRYLENPKIWCHCKNQGAYDILSKNPLVNCFQHNDEDCVKTSQGYIWVHSRWSPGEFLNKFSGSNFLDFSDMSKFVFTWFVDKTKFDNWNVKNTNIQYGICSDYVESYKELIE